MATYKGTVGTTVVNYAGNYPGAVEGELWYDSTNKNFNYQYPNVATAAWASGGNLNNARASMGTGGTAGSALGTGGYGNPPAGVRDFTELYNGVSWTEVNQLNTGRQLNPTAGASSTSALVFGGGPPQRLVESWNGTCWNTK
jgi:hypothetical protein